MPRRIFTPAAIGIIRKLAGEGKSTVEIADALGSTPGSVRVKCCQLKIRLRRRGHPSLVPSLEGRKLVIYMRPEDYAALEREAADKQKFLAEYAGMLLEAIVSANLYDAVLDECH